jgi:hypothetical protein
MTYFDTSQFIYLNHLHQPDANGLERTHLDQDESTESAQAYKTCQFEGSRELEGGSVRERPDSAKDTSSKQVRRRPTESPNGLSGRKSSADKRKYIMLQRRG